MSRRTRLLLALCLMFGVSAAAAAQAKQPAKQPSKKAKKVWTNDDLDELLHRRPVSKPATPAAETPAPEGEAAASETETPSPPGEAAPPAEGAAKPAEPAEPYAKDKDPKWYQERAAALRAELDRMDGEIRRLRDFKSNPTRGQAGLTLGKENLSLTPENQIGQLEQRRRQVQQELDDLEAQARRNGFSPGVTR